MKIDVSRNTYTKDLNCTNHTHLYWYDNKLITKPIGSLDAASDIVLTLKVFNCIFNGKYKRAVDYLKEFIATRNSRYKSIIIEIYDEDTEYAGSGYYYPIFSIEDGRLFFRYRIAAEAHKYNEWEEFGFNFIDNCNKADDIAELIKRFNLFADMYNEYYEKDHEHIVYRAVNYLKHFSVDD